MGKGFVIRVRVWYLFFTMATFFTVVALPWVIQPVAMIQSGSLEPIRHGALDRPAVAFACNVFWGEEYLPDMLRIFEEKGIHITFFIGGSWARRFPEALKEIGARGHELANHSYTHPHPNSLTKEQNIDQIRRTEELIAQITGSTTRLYAPPYGEYNHTVLQAAYEAGYQTTLWSIDTIDWKKPPPDVLEERVMKKLHGGAIILMHPTASTVQALPNLLQKIHDRGYTVTTVSAVIAGQ